VEGSVVHLKEITNNIIQVTMEDRNNKNMFSNALIAELIKSFDMIRKNVNYKVVILTGYDNYFCSGGTKENLLDIQKGKSKFTDINILTLLLDCEIPVISAMQGHGIGAGFSFGLYADFIILSRESFYSAVYMKYGFTPGFGATYILPKKLGFNLAMELLFTADNYRGAELEKRGAPCIFMPKNILLNYAYEFAGKLAEKPRLSLTTLKHHFTKPILEHLKIIIDQELEMHEITFINNDDVKDKINKSF
jgi:polyketide biosynthesis enoyl-CoA hydratase PksI